MRIQSELGRIQSGVGRIQSDLERIQLGLTVLKNFNGGVVGALDICVKKSNGDFEKGQWGIEKIRRGYCVGSMQPLGAWRKGQW